MPLRAGDARIEPGLPGRRYAMGKTESQRRARGERRFGRLLRKKIPSLSQLLDEFCSYDADGWGLPITSPRRVRKYRPKSADERRHKAWTLERLEEAESLHEAAEALLGDDGRIVADWAEALDYVRQLEEEWGESPLHGELRDVIAEWLQWKISVSQDLSEIWDAVLELDGIGSTPSDAFNRLAPRRLGGKTPEGSNGWDPVAWDRERVIVRKGYELYLLPRVPPPCTSKEGHTWEPDRWGTNYAAHCARCKRSLHKAAEAF